MQVIRSTNALFSTVVFEEFAGSTAYLFLLRNGEQKKFAEKNLCPIEPDEIPVECWDSLQSQLEKLLADQNADC